MASTTFSETELQILAAALEEFSMHGRQGARMQCIADRAGLNKALLHYYFRSKDRLYEEVFTYVFHTYFFQLADTLRAEGDFPTVLRAFIHRYVDMLNENPALPMFLLREVAEGAPVFSRRLPEIVQANPLGMPKLLLALFEESSRSGESRKTDPFQTLISIMGACIYFFAGFPIFSTLIPELRDRRDQLIEERKDHIFELVYYGLKPRTE
ncbi:MAG: TetR/AcrR family transcriptional regulator [Bacteroidetes bacterium]|nr:TetR/AcrR family transcriptional regulator [Bacteroidota bacterium]